MNKSILVHSLLLGILMVLALPAQIELRDINGAVISNGTSLNFGNYTSLPATSNQDLTIVNTGSTGIRISSITFIDTDGVTYSSGVYSSGFSQVSGSVGSGGVEVALNGSHSISVSFFGNREGHYRSTLKIEFFLADEGSTKAPEAKSYYVHLDASTEITTPTQPDPTPEKKGEPIPSHLKSLFPNGFPTDDILYYGDSEFKSDTFGTFVADTSNKNRFVHEILGPFVWSQDSNSLIVTLHSEWWGGLTTATPGVRTNLGYEFPYLYSEITGATYFVDVNADMSNPRVAPFYNHRRVNGNDIGWQRSIGVDLWKAENYFKASQTLVGQMQTVMANMTNLVNEYSALNVTIAGGHGPIDNKFDQINAQFLAMHETYQKFVFYYHRCSLAPVWAEREGMTVQEIALTEAYVAQLPPLIQIAQNVYATGQVLLYEQAATIRQQKRNELEVRIAEEAARAAAEAAAAAAAANQGGTGSALDKALGGGLRYSSGGSGKWAAQSNTTRDGLAAGIGPYGDGWVKTTVQGPGTIEFWWFVKGFSYAEFSINGRIIYKDDCYKYIPDWGKVISGTGWIKKSYRLYGGGKHTLQWKYRTDLDVQRSDRLYLDQVSFR